MQLQDPHILKVEHVDVEGDEGSDNGMILSTTHFELLLSEAELEWLLKYCRMGRPPKP